MRAHRRSCEWFWRWAGVGFALTPALLLIALGVVALPLLRGPARTPAAG